MTTTANPAAREGGLCPHRKCRWQALSGVLVALALAVGAPTFAQSHDSAGDQASAGHEEAEDAHGHHGAHPHHVSVLLGAANNRHLHETAFTVGASYRYALADRVAIGPMVDFASFEHEDTILVLAALFWKPVGDLLLVAAPGVEILRHDSSPHGASTHSDPVETPSGSETEFAFRVGAGYELHAGRLTITPAVGADFVGGHTTVVYALTFGVGF